MPLISVVVCCHNRRDFLPQTMEAIFKQKYRPIEIVVLDDGSNDGTKELMSQYGERIRYYWQENKGIARTRTRACDLANGEFIAFQDDDDLMTPNRIVDLYDALMKYPNAIFSTGDYVFIDPKGNIGKRWPPGDLDEYGPPRLIENAYHEIIWPNIPALPHTTLFRKESGNKIGWFDHDFKYASSDKDFYARLARLGSIVYLRKVVSYYRRGHSSIWGNEIRAMYSRLQLLEKHLSLVDANDAELYSRLQQRILEALKRIAKLRSTGFSVDDSELEQHINRCIPLLRRKQRLAYVLYKNVKIPLRRLTYTR
ncbi:MAG: glycosyltransferase family 2 protein [Gammaproteobacteria bacterium]